MCYTPNGSSLVSADADGVVKLWDVRMVAEVLTIACSKYPANKATFDASSLVSLLQCGLSRLLLFTLLCYLSVLGVHAAALC